MGRDAAVDGSKIETEPVKLEGLNKFIEKVKDGRLVKFWNNADELCTQLSQTLYKAMARGNRPGWVRTTEFDIEESHAKILELMERVHVLEALNADLKIQNNRKPHLWVETLKDNPKDEELEIKDGVVRFKVVPVYMKDAENGIDYKNHVGRIKHASREEVRLFRNVCKNGFILKMIVHNDGEARATGVRVHWQFPDELLVMSHYELKEYYDPDAQGISKDAYENWNARFFGPEGKSGEGERFISLDGWSFRKNGTLIPELAEHDSGLNGTSISDKTERLSVY